MATFTTYPASPSYNDPPSWTLSGPNFVQSISNAYAYTGADMTADPRAGTSNCYFYWTSPGPSLGFVSATAISFNAGASGSFPNPAAILYAELFVWPVGPRYDTTFPMGTFPNPQVWNLPGPISFEDWPNVQLTLSTGPDLITGSTYSLANFQADTTYTPSSALGEFMVVSTAGWWPPDCGLPPMKRFKPLCVMTIAEANPKNITAFWIRKYGQPPPGTVLWVYSRPYSGNVNANPNNHLYTATQP